MTIEKIIIVNDKDKVIGAKERGTLKSDDIYRVSVLWVQNSKGEILLAQRALNKVKDPGKWGTAAAGTNSEGETYESNILKEAREEIGLINPKIEKVLYKKPDQRRQRFSQYFFALADKDISEFTLQKEEVAQIKWFTREELQKALQESPDDFLVSIKDSFDFFSIYKI